LLLAVALGIVRKRAVVPNALCVSSMDLNYKDTNLAAMYSSLLPHQANATPRQRHTLQFCVGILPTRGTDHVHALQSDWTVLAALDEPRVWRGGDCVVSGEGKGRVTLAR